MYLLTTFKYKPLNDKKLETIKNKIAKTQDDKILYTLKPNKPKYNNELAENSRRQIRNLKADYWTKEAARVKAARVKTSTAIVKTTNPVSTSKLLTGKKLALGAGALAATGLGIAAVNRLRKSRSDKGKKRK